MPQICAVKIDISIYKYSLKVMKILEIAYIHYYI